MIDLRSKEIYQAGHIERTLNIPLNKKFLTYAGWFLDYEGQVTLIGTKEQAETAARYLQLIGFDQVRGYLDAGQIKDDKMTETITAAAFIALRQAKDLQILDVRSKSEWDRGHLSDAKRVLLGKLLEDPLPFKRDEPLYVHCQSGVRSAVAIGALEERGFKRLSISWEDTLRSKRSSTNRHKCVRTCKTQSEQQKQPKGRAATGFSFRLFFELEHFNPVSRNSQNPCTMVYY